MTGGIVPTGHGSQPLVDRVQRLPDGRKLGWAEWGDPAGRPVMVFHGNGGSRLLPPPKTRLPGMRYICPERPGFGLSDFKPGRRLDEWPADVAQLADALEIDRFGCVGLSAGGPYALACVWAMPDRVSAVALVGGALPPAMLARNESRRENRLLFALARSAPWLLRLKIARLTHEARRRPERLEARFRKILLRDQTPDVRMLDDPELWSLVVQEEVEGFRNGGKGVWWDIVVATKPWGFALDQIAIPVQIWNGAEDRQCLPEAARWLAERIPSATLQIVEDRGHLFFFDHWDEIIASLRA